VEELLVRGGHHVTMLDGDQVRSTDRSRLGFTKSDRDLQVRRVAMLAREVVDRGDIAVCALVSPYAASWEYSWTRP
jgi:sulfate adenylyltransferase